MKTRSLVSIAVALLLAAFAAPQAVEGQITLGLKGGANFADLSNVADQWETARETSFVGGAYALIGFGGKFGIQPELLYSQRASTLTPPNEESAKVSTDYIEIPLLLNYRLLTGLIEPQLYAGGSVSFETECSFTPEGSSSGSCDEEFDATTTLWAGIVGAAVDLDLGIFEFGVDARYNYGFTNLAPDDTEADEPKWRYFSIMGQVGIAIGR
jgi:opacity protein-like surface antigen